MMSDNLRSAVGIVALLACAALLSEHRRSIRWGKIALGIGLSAFLIAVLLNVPPVRAALGIVKNGVGAVASATRAGTTLVFGYLGGGPLPFDSKAPGSEFILAFQALPTVLVISVLTTLLFYWRILPPIIRGFSGLLQRTLGVGGAAGLSTAANVVGMVEAPMFIAPLVIMIAGLTTMAPSRRSEILSLGRVHHFRNTGHLSSRGTCGGAELAITFQTSRQAESAFGNDPTSAAGAFRNRAAGRSAHWTGA
jgi:nucleoside permease NupC